MARVLIFHHEWDADFAEPLCAYLRELGHVPLAHAAGSGAPPRASADDAFVLVWSSALMLDEAALEEAARLAASRPGAIVRIDDTMPSADIIDLNYVVNAGSIQAAEAIKATAAALRLDPQPRLIRLPHVQWPHLSKPMTLALAGGGVLVACIAGATALTSSMARSPPSDGLRPRSAPTAHDWSAGHALLRSEDPIALRAAVMALGSSPEAELLRARLASLEDDAWRAAEATQDAGQRLLAIEAFRMAFPDSARLAGVAADMTRQARSEIMAAQQGLSAAGFDPGPATGVMTPRTTQAARLYQERAGLPRTGEIDARLLAALAAATGHNSDGALSPGRLHQSREDFRQGGGPLPLSVIQDCRECPALVVLPMGSGQVGDAGADGDPSERPARLVNLDYGLAIGQFEVSVAEWDACVDDRGCTHRPRPLGAAHPNAPVVDVSHDDAKHYLAWLRRRTGQGYRLPSEAEWEFAARAGARFTAQSDLALGLCVTGNIADRASPFPLRDETCFDGYANARAPVGQFQPNGFGLFDMTGNVWEWTEDCWHASYQGAPLSPSPWLRGCDSRARVLRGGSFMTGPGHNRISARLGVSAELRLRDVGFRVVRPVAF